MKPDYNIIAIIFIVILVGLITKMTQTQEHFATMSRLQRGKEICQSETMKPWTVTHPDDIEVKNIVNTVLQHVNQKLKMNYHLGKFDNITKETDKEGNKRYLIDFFAFHLDMNQRTDITRRLILDVTQKGKDLVVNLLTIGNAKKYGPPNVLEQPEDDDNELILKDTNLQNFHPVVGHLQPSLEYGVNPLEMDMNHLANRDRQYQSWIYPKGAEKISSIYPCRKQQKWWDESGVHYTDDTKANCNGIDSSATCRPKIAQHQAGHAKLLSQPNQYTWLFDRARGDQSSEDPLSGSTIQPYWEYKKA